MISLAGANEELVKKYAKKFEKMSANDIASFLHKQISGHSKNAKTLAMFDAIPDDKLLNVYGAFSRGNDPLNPISAFSSFMQDKEYRGFRKEPLFMAMFAEYGMSSNEIIPRMDRFANVAKSSNKYRNMKGSTTAPYRLPLSVLPLKKGDKMKLISLN